MHCTNAAQILDLEECPRKPWCQISMVRVSRNRGAKQYCENCEQIGPRQRVLNAQNSRRRQRRAQQGLGGSQSNPTRNLPQHDRPIVLAGYRSAEDEDGTLNAAQTMMALSQGIRTVPTLPPNETAPSLPTTPFTNVRSAQNEDEAHDAAARSMIALSQGIQTAPNPPPNEAEPFPLTPSFVNSQSAEDEDGAHDAASILIDMRQENVHAPRPSQPGPRKAEFQRFPPFRSRMQQQMNVVSSQQPPQHPRNRAVLPRPPPYELSRNIRRREPSVTVTNTPPFRSQMQQEMNEATSQQAPQHPMSRAVLPRPPPHQLSRTIRRP